MGEKKMGAGCFDNKNYNKKTLTNIHNNDMIAIDHDKINSACYDICTVLVQVPFGMYSTS